MNRMNHISREMVEDLFRVLAGLETAEECEAFFQDLCTMQEIGNMAQRVRAAKLLLEGKTYSQVIEETDISSATLSRVSRCVQYGGGYSRVLGKGTEE